MPDPVPKRTICDFADRNIYRLCYRKCKPRKNHAE